MVAPILKLKLGGRKNGVVNYSEDEMNHLFDVMEIILPIAPDEWEQVAQAHHKKFGLDRTVLSLRRKYLEYHRKPILTGNPNIPPLVRRAKTVKHMLGVKVEFGTGSVKYDLLTGDGGGNQLSSLTQDATQDVMTPQDTGLMLGTAGGVTDGTGTVVGTGPVVGTGTGTVVGSAIPIVPIPGSNNSNIGSEFLDAMKVFIELDREARKESIERDREERKESIKRDREERKESIEREREERKECRKMMMESLSVIAQTIALAFGGKKKKKRKRSNDLEVDDESDTESE